MSNTTTLGSRLQDVPNLLRSHDRWCLWHYQMRNGQLTKVPVNTDWANSNTWLSYEQVLRQEVPENGGVGFILSGGLQLPEGKLFAFDLDACRDPVTGTVERWAWRFIERCGKGFTEITPSSTGLRVWAIVRNPPTRWGRVKRAIDAPRAPNTGTKAVECQVFGATLANGYVTVTGLRFDGTGEEIPVVEDLSWWKETLGCSPEDGFVGDELAELPVGPGEPPTPGEIRTKIDASERGQIMVQGRWREFYKNNGEGKSASDLYFHLVREALIVSGGHGKSVANFLLYETAYGMERVESREVAKYAKRDWVEKQVRVIAGKTQSAFTPLEPEAEAVVFTVQPEAKKQRFRMRQWEAVLADPPMRWLVDDLIPRNGLVVLGGQSGAAKTLLVLDAGLRMVHGMEWMGKKAKPASMLYLAGEGGGGLGARLRAWKAQHREVMKANGEYLAVMDGVPNLASATAVDTLMAMLEQAKEENDKMPEVVVIDTLAMAAPGADENESKEMGLVLRVLAEVRLRTGCTFIVLHHLRKLPPGGGGSAYTMDALRGSTAVAGAADVILLAVKEGKTERTLRTVKSRDGEEGEPVGYRVHKLPTGALREDGRVEVAPVILPHSAPQAAVEAPQDDRDREAEERVTEALRELGGSAGRIDAVVRKAGLKLTVGRDAFDRLLGRGAIRETRVKGRSVYSTSTTAGSVVPPTPPVRGTRDAGGARLGGGLRPETSGDDGGRPGTTVLLDG